MFERLLLLPQRSGSWAWTEAFRAADTRSHKINLGVGIYKDETGATLSFTASASRAEALTDEKTQELPRYRRQIEYGLRIVQQLPLAVMPPWRTSGQPRRRRRRAVLVPRASPPSSWYATISPRPSGSS